MFCPSCGARNQAPARSCAECGRVLPSARAAAPATTSGAALKEPALTEPDQAPVAPPPTVSERPLAPPPATVADRPSAAPAEAPRILRRPAPLAPAPVDVVPRSLRPPAAVTMPGVDPDGPTQIKRPPGFEERMVGDIVRLPPRRETPAAVEGVAGRAVPRPVTTATRSPPAPAATPPAPRLPPAPPPPTPAPLPQPPRTPVAAPVAQHADMDTGATAPVQRPELALPPPVLVLGSGWPLLLARLVDTVLTAALAAGALYGALLALGIRPAVQPVVDQAHTDPAPMSAVLVGAPFVAIAFYQALTVMLLGGTVGCRLAGMRVVRVRDGARPGVARSLVRGLASAVGALSFGCGPLWGVLVDRRRRGLGDIVARSAVVRAARGGAA